MYLLDISERYLVIFNKMKVINYCKTLNCQVLVDNFSVFVYIKINKWIHYH